jgi:hypothetical protein
MLAIFINKYFLAHLAFRQCELLSSLFVRRLSSVVRPSTFHILIFSSETTGPIATKFGGMVLGWPPFKMCPVIPTSNQDGRQAKNRKRGDEILIVHCCFNVSQNELIF